MPVRGGHNELYLGLTVGALCVALWQARSHRRVSNDLTTLSDAARELLRRGVRTKPIRLRTRQAQSAWNTFALNRSRVSRMQSENDTYSEILSLSGRLGANGLEHRAEAGELAQLLAAVGKPEVQAVWILQGESQQLKFLAGSGGTAERARSVVLKHARLILEQGGAAQSAVVDLTTDPLEDTRVLGVGGLLVVPIKGPIRAERTNAGAIVFGVVSGISSISAQRRIVLSALADHVAAVYASAQRTVQVCSEQQREREYFLGLSHDLKSPGIRALYALRELRSVDCDRERSFEIIEQAIAEQLEMIGETVDVVRYRSGTMTSNPVRIGISAALLPLLAGFRGQAQAKRLDLLVKIPEEHVIEVDPVQFRRVIGNLLSNAIKYTSIGGVELSVTTRGELLECRIADTGMGVPETERGKLFTEFFRAGNCGEIPGSGIGLAIAKRLIEANGGSIAYEPNPFGGAIFTVSVKRGAAEAPPAESLQMSRILVVEDDPACARIVERHCRRIGPHIATAHSLAEARRKLRVERFELVISDGSLGDGNVEDLLPEIPSETALLLVTGDTNRSALTDLVSRRNSTVLEKPVEPLLLEQIVRRLLCEVQPRSSRQPLKAAVAAIAAFFALVPSGTALAEAADNLTVSGMTFACPECRQVNQRECLVPETGADGNRKAVLVQCSAMLEQLLRELNLEIRATGHFPGTLPRPAEFVQFLRAKGSNASSKRVYELAAVAGAARMNVLGASSELSSAELLEFARLLLREFPSAFTSSRSEQPLRAALDWAWPVLQEMDSRAAIELFTNAILTDPTAAQPGAPIEQLFSQLTTVDLVQDLARLDVMGETARRLNDPRAEEFEQVSKFLEVCAGSASPQAEGDAEVSCRPSGLPLHPAALVYEQRVQTQRILEKVRSAKGDVSGQIALLATLTEEHSFTPEVHATVESILSGVADDTTAKQLLLGNSDFIAVAAKIAERDETIARMLRELSASVTETAEEYDQHRARSPAPSVMKTAVGWSVAELSVGAAALLLGALCLRLALSRFAMSRNALILPDVPALSPADAVELTGLKTYFSLSAAPTIYELTRSYRQRARSVHPDTSGCDAAEFADLHQRYLRCRTLLER